MVNSWFIGHNVFGSKKGEELIASLELMQGSYRFLFTLYDLKFDSISSSLVFFVYVVLIVWYFCVCAINHLHPGSFLNLSFIFKKLKFLKKLLLNLRFAFCLALAINKLDLLVDYCLDPG